MLSYLLHDMNKVSEIYPDLVDADKDAVEDALEFGSGIRVFQNGGLQDAETGQVLLDVVDDELIDEDDFELEAQEAGVGLEVEDNDDRISVVVNDISMRCVAEGDEEDEEEDGEDTLGVVVGDLALSCVLSE